MEILLTLAGDKILTKRGCPGEELITKQDATAPLSI